MSQGGSISSGTTSPAVLLQTKTASNQATVVFTGITSAYKMYRVLINGLQVAQGGGTFLRLRCSTNNGVSYDSGNNYSFTQTYHGSDSSQDWNRSSAASGIELILPTPDSAVTTDNGYLDIALANLASTTQFKLLSAQASVISTTACIDTEIAGSYNIATAVNAIQFDTNTATNIFAGTFELYGIS